MTDVRPLSDYHFLKLDDETLRDPYPFFRRLRAECPVFQEPDYGVYLVTRYDDIARVTKDTESFSAAPQITGPWQPLPAPVDELEEYRRRAPESEKLFTNDPPDHTRYRRLVNRLFAPRRIEGLENRLTELANRLIDHFIDRGEVEFVGEFAHIFPLTTVGELLGIPPDDNERFEAMFREQYAHMDSVFPGNPDGAGTTQLTFQSVLVDYFSSELAARRRDPRNDIMSELCNATFSDGEEVPLHELVKICIFIYGAGGDSNTPELLVNGMDVLLDRQDVMSALRSDPAKIANFVQETLRYDNSATGLFRVARTDTEIGGVAIPKGALVMAMFASGNHDENYFDDPEEFRLERKTRPILSFGSGPHTCPGAPLARLEAQIAFRELLARLDDIRRAVPKDELRYLPSCLQRSFARLHLTFTPIR
jgi:cytochrome P450